MATISSPPDDIVGRIRLHRAGDSRPILLCEGRLDRQLLTRLFGTKAAVFSVGTRELVPRKLSELLSVGVDRVIAVIDRDLDDFIARQRALGLPVVAFDDADVESSLWASDALDRTVELLASAPKLDAVGGVEAVRERVDRTLVPLQKLRLASVRNRLGLDFERIDLRSRLRRSKMELSLPGMVDTLRFDRPDLGRQWLIDLAENSELEICPETGNTLFRGKDRCAVLGAKLRHEFGNLHGADTEHSAIARNLLGQCQSQDVEHQTWVREIQTFLEE